ncbi:MAG: hypothetical protein IK077_03445 [Thermoguttaceae bacterium]|nr:hypothetical protein [Thermoguttaceae bacterium]
MDEIKELADKISQGLIYLWNWYEQSEPSVRYCEYVADSPGDLIWEIQNDVNRIAELAEEHNDQ